ncbi:succinylglutamate desuccinylase/aspartoacylase family protein [Roseateles oligotrophus]|uniref:M14 family metallopeptidase n=1 Tax=Roseateles oligotrophus TaxID=1769250 RepID=A0ABT2YLJ9_9BURK|nr:succinylglutamate desuccinylase/aspartoacylase family protein [Roseateles oligotrophus]MCV2370872.1 M14 family metallopeptidase [Roseateles oligotrophus]
MQTRLHPLMPASAGTARHVRSLHFGRAESGRKAYIQASLHADEVPPMLVAQALRERLLALEAAGLIAGEIVLLPMANPIGLSQEMQGVLCGRFDMSTGINFNRNYRHLSAELIPLLEPLLGADPQENRRLIRTTCLALLAAKPAQTQTENLKLILQTLAMDADIVLDLHCDTQAVMHVYTGTPLAEAAKPLARLLGAQALLLSRASGDDPFDETIARIWWELAEHFGPGRPVPLACFAATVELRGELQVEPALALQDARALLEFLRQAGHIDGPVDADLAALAPLCEATPLEGVEPITAPHNGVLVFRKQPGDWLSAGEVVAEVIDPLTDQRSLLQTTVSGRLFARVSRPYASAGMRVCKVAGSVAFRSGKLLSL